MKKSLKFRTMAGILAWIIALGTVPPVVSSANEIEEDPPAEVIESVAADYLGEVDDETEPEGTELDVTEPEKEDSEETSGEGGSEDNSENTSGEGAPEDNSENTSGEGAPEDNSENTSGEGVPEDNSEKTSGEGAPEDNSENTSGEGASEDNSEKTSGEGAPEDNSENTSGEGGSEDNSENTSGEDAPEDNSEGTSEEEPQPEESSLYEQLLVSETLTEMYVLLTAEENAETLLQLTEEEIAELLVKADGLYEMVEPYGEEFALYEEIVYTLNELPNAPESVTEENPEEENSEEDSEELGTAQEIMAEFAAAVAQFPDDAEFILYDEENNVVTRDDEAYYRAYAAFYEENPDIWTTTDALYNEASEAFDAENHEVDLDTWLKDNGFWEAVEKFYWIPAPETVAEMIAQYEEDEEVETENTVEEEAPVIDPVLNALYEYRFKMYAYDENVYAQDAVVEPYATDGIMPEAFLNVYVEWTTLTVEEIDALDVTVVELYDETYEQMVEYALERYGEEELYKLRAYEVNFLLNGEPVEMTANPMTMEVELLNYERESMTFARVEEQEPAPEAEVGTILSTLTLDETGAPVEVGSVFVEEGAEEETATLMSFKATGSNVVVYTNSTTANPSFTVQYYANIEVVADTGNTSLAAINTNNGGTNSGGNLPKNGTTPAIRDLYLQDVSENSEQKTIATDTVLEPVYSSGEFTYVVAPNLAYFNRLYENGNYQLSGIWVLRDGESSTSTSEADWIVYKNVSDIHFTNRDNHPDINNGNMILIKDNTVIRLVFDTEKDTYQNDVTFFDYDISEGKTETVNGVERLKTGMLGINSSGNYHGTGTKLAFGNSNTVTGLGALTWIDENGNSNKLNTGDSDNYKSCTFGLVDTLNSDGSIKFSDGVIAPTNLFGNSSATGKTVYNNYSLIFDQTGDTYTLSMIDNKNTSGIVNILDNDLTKFNFTTYFWGTTNPIWSNNFWPMDVVTGADGHFGGTPIRYAYGYPNNSTEPASGAAYSATTELPESDDGKNHNSYFGMQYAVHFELTKDYIGPLEYLFFGDDDMWVFLSETDEEGKEIKNSQLVCDIGGVHSSVGEFVNLWDYIEKGSEGHYRLDFFYTERGASGSTCYMRFTLPSVSSITPEMNTGTLRIEKQVESPFGLDGDFKFEIVLKDSDGNELYDDYSYTKFFADGHTDTDIIVHTGDEFTLRDGEYIIIKYLPVGTQYSVKEVDIPEEFTSTYVSINGDEREYKTVAEGDIPDQNKTENVLYVNVHHVIVDTAVHLDYLPYIILFAIVGTGVIIAASDKRREADE